MRLLAFTLLALLLAAPAGAHRVSIFAWVEDGHVHSRSGFGKSSPVKRGTVEVYDAAADRLLTSGPTNTDGRFSFPLDNTMREATGGLRLVILAGEGHRGEWLVEAGEYLDEPQPAPTSAPAEAPPAAKPALARTELEALLERKLAPIRQSLAELRDPEPTLRDILGGLGWLVGLCGAYAYGASRR